MSITGLLDRGIRSVLDDASAQAELRDLLANQAMHPDAGEHLQLTVAAVPGLLVSMRRALSAPATPDHARELFILVLGYVLDDENLIPSHAGRPLLGLLDDVYMIHLAALALQDHVSGIDMRSVAGGASLLEEALPRLVTAELKNKILTATASTRRRPR